MGGQSSKLKYVGPESSSVIEFAAVFDGHGGDEVAVEAQRALADALYVSFHNFFDAGENKVEAIEEETETKIKAALAVGCTTASYLLPSHEWSFRRLL